MKVPHTLAHPPILSAPLYQDLTSCKQPLLAFVYKSAPWSASYTQLEEVD